VLHRRKGAADFTRARLPAPDLGASASVELPPVLSGELADAATGAIVQVQVVGYDAAGWEIYRDTRPLEVPVGFAPLTPLWRRWWVWAAAGGVLAAAVVTAAVVMQPEPSGIETRYEVVP
jgi:hypothetical protein